MTKTTEPETTVVEIDAKAKYIALLAALIVAHKNILASDHPDAAEVSNKLLQTHGLCLRQIKRLKKGGAK